MTIKVAILGSKGRMGAEVVKAVSNASDLELVASIDQNDDFNIVKNSGAQVAVDFTTPDSVMKNLELLIEAGISPVVAKTTPDDKSPPKTVSFPASIQSIGLSFDLRSRAYRINTTRATAIEVITNIICVGL